MDDITSQAPQFLPPLANTQPFPTGPEPLGQTLVFQSTPGKQTAFHIGGGRGIFRGVMWSRPAGLDPFMSGMMMTVQRFVVESQQRQQRWNSTVLAMRESVRSLTNEVATLKCEIQRLHRLRTYVVPLATLTPEPFRMIQQIPVTIEGDGDDFTATFVEANVSASGETEADAIANFKDSLLSSYEILEGMPSSELGPLPTRQWTILRDVVKRIE
jgi:hypothetical protein